LLDGGTHTIKADNVVLCTNGFQSITIINETGLEINTKFHHLIHGTVGYMSGYLEDMNKQPTAISYLTDPDPSTDDPYFYLTRRMYEYEAGKSHNLISIGGPEIPLEDTRKYSHEEDFPEEMTETIDEFVRQTYDVEPNKKIDYKFTWHGLMGYTKNGVRLVGPEPKNPVLMYNLGCNGIGILPSIFGGKRISGFIAGQDMGDSIFDVPKEYRA
jgi:glycine/D-amino acid oxidase-like deaminating enzyme